MTNVGQNPIAVRDAQDRILAPLPQGLGEEDLPLALAGGRVAAQALRSPRAGVVRQVNVVPGQTVAQGDLLVRVEEAEG